MTGIHTAVVRFQDLKRNLAALEMEVPGENTRGAFTVIELVAGALELGDELVGNLEAPGAVDLFNRSRHDHVQATVRLAQTTRDDAVAYMKS
jgi:hypothetical protein